MKFENIKVGDTVLVKKEIKYRLYSAESFLIPVKVTRVTPTQFITDGDIRFKKQDGSKIGGSHYDRAYFENETYRDWRDGKIAKDQTLEMNLFIQKLNLETEINRQIESIKISKNSIFSIDELKAIKSKIDDVMAMTNVLSK